MNFKEWLLAETQQTYSFSSTQIDFQAKDAQKVLSWSKSHIPDKLLVENDKAGGRETNIHVTVLYGLHDSNANNVKPVIEKVQPFKIILGKISKFEGETYDVIKIEIKGEALHQLNRKLSKLPHTNKFKKYNPHCTIAYVKKGSCDHLLENKHFQGMQITVNSITFSSKHGKKTKINL